MDNRSPDASYFHVSVSPGFTLYLVWYLFTFIPTLIANVSIHRMVSVYLFSLLSVRHLFSFHLSLSLPNALQIFLNIYHKNSKNIVHPLLRFICTRSFVELVSPPHTFIHTVLINPPLSYNSILFRFTAPLVHYYPLHLHPYCSPMLTHFLSSYAILCHIVLAVDTIHMLLSIPERLSIYKYYK